VRQGSRQRVGPVLAQNRGRVGELLQSIARPQLHREALQFPLQIIPDEKFCVVADVEIHARQPLVIGLIEEQIVGPVVATGGGGSSAADRAS
jgi:hypothetical protein